MNRPTDGANAQDMLDVFMRALVGADRVVVQTRNAIGEYDAHYLHAPELNAAMLRACKGRVRVDIHTVSSEVFKAIVWGTQQPPLKPHPQ